MQCNYLSYILAIRILIPTVLLIEKSVLHFKNKRIKSHITYHTINTILTYLLILLTYQFCLCLFAREWFFFSRKNSKCPIRWELIIALLLLVATYLIKQAILLNQEAKDKLLSYKVGVRHSDYLLAKASISQAIMVSPNAKYSDQIIYDFHIETTTCHI